MTSLVEYNKDQAFSAAEANSTFFAYKLLVKGAMHLPDQTPSDLVPPPAPGMGCGGG